jgi:hypothetical protein
MWASDESQNKQRQKRQPIDLLMETRYFLGRNRISKYYLDRASEVYATFNKRTNSVN